MRTLRSINDVWVYDNPDTEMREIFKNGHLITYFPRASMDKGSWWNPDGEHRWIQLMYLDDLRTLGAWSEGAEYGDRIHKPFDPLATELWSNRNG